MMSFMKDNLFGPFGEVIWKHDVKFKTDPNYCNTTTSTIWKILKICFEWLEIYERQPIWSFVQSFK